jgi:DNA-binding response OmpR family regulator
MAKAFALNRSETALSAVLCILFELSQSEGRILGRLLLNDYCSADGLCRAAGHDGQPITTGTLRVTFNSLRRKLRLHDIGISTVQSLGYGLRVRGRERIYSHLVRHDPGLVPERPRPKGEAELASQP